MFDSIADETLGAAHDAAGLLYANHEALGLEMATAIKLDTLRVDIAVELETRASRPGPASATG